MDDTEAVRRCQDGDQAAFRPIVDRYGPVLYGTAFLMTYDRGKAEELAQDAFLQAWRGICSFQPGTNLKAWLVRILVNGVNSDRRRMRLRPAPFDDSSPVQGGPDSEDALRHAEDRIVVGEAMLKLPREQQRLLILRYYTDLTVADIAAALETPEGTVKSRLHRALERLRQAMESPGPVDVTTAPRVCRAGGE